MSAFFGYLSTQSNAFGAVELGMRMFSRNVCACLAFLFSLELAEEEVQALQG